MLRINFTESSLKFIFENDFNVYLTNLYDNNRMKLKHISLKHSF